MNVDMLMIEFLYSLLFCILIICVECILHPYFGVVCLWCLYSSGTHTQVDKHQFLRVRKVALRVILVNFLFPNYLVGRYSDSIPLGMEQFCY